MGVITDFFLASSSDVARVLSGWQLPPQPVREPPALKPARLPNGVDIPLRSEPHWVQPPKPNPDANPAPKIDSLPNVQCKGMLPDKLALLFATLTEIPAERALDLIVHGYLTGPPEPEVTVQRLPAALTTALASANGSDLLRAAQAIEEDDIDRWGGDFRGTSSELTNVLSRVQSLAKHGLSTNADLFIWTCT
jgi:hypothetical protein